MKTTYQQISRGVVFLICCLAASWAQAATFNLSFFGRNNQQVGQGQFTTDPNKILTFTSDDQAAIQGCLGSGQTLRECGLQRDYTNQVTKFSATIQGVSSDNATTLDVDWGLEASAWWKGAGHGPGHFASSRYFASGAAPDWFFGDPFFGLRQLKMDFNAATDLTGSGTWFMGAGYSDFNGQNPLPAFVYGDGTWIATATPIPAAVWLFASGLGALGVFRREKNLKL